MFEVRCDRKLLCVSPTLKGAENFLKRLIRSDLKQKELWKWDKMPKYEIIEEVLEVV